LGTGISAVRPYRQAISPQFIKPYVKGNKNDSRNAEAICEAVSRPHMRFVPLKTVESQDIQAIHRLRSRLIKERTARWLWHALDHHTGRVLAYVVGTRKDATFLKLRALLAPFGLTRYYTDKAGVYRRHLSPAQHTVGKLTRQKIERKHLTVRTRLNRFARKTLSFSRSGVMHDLLIGLYMNRVEFGCAA